LQFNLTILQRYLFSLKFHKVVIFIIVICYVTNSVAQTNEIYFLRGQVVDKIRQQPLPYCNVSLKGKSIGTLSNETGFYEFKVKKEHLLDSLTISALGYQPALFLVNEILQEEWLKIELEPAAINLSEITISAIPPLKIVQRALENINDNYPTSSFISESFYREYITENQQYKRLIEASLKILEKGYTDNRALKLKQIVSVEKIKKNHDYRTLKNYYWNGIEYLMNENIRGINPGGVINTYPLKDWKFTCDETTQLNGEEVFIVNFKPASTNIARPEGILYITTTDYAILKLDYSITTGLENWHYSSLSDTTYLKYYGWETAFNYKRYNHKLYLNYLTHQRKFKVLHKQSQAEFFDVAINNELLVINIEKKNVLNFVDKHNEDYNYLLMRNEEFDKAYWREFNLPPITEKLRKIYNQISRLGQEKRLSIIKFLKNRERMQPQ